MIGVSVSASAPSIKQAYRRLVKRWHPDRYPSGTQGHVEATQMTKLINEAYAAIRHAPLRYYVEPHPVAPGTSGQTGWASTYSPRATYEPRDINSEALRKGDRLEFWVRFVCGALLGALISFRLLLMTSDLGSLVVGVVLIAVGLGFAADRYGDKFWYWIFRYWWFWS